MTLIPASSHSSPPDGAAGGDLSGSYPDPTVAKINGSPLATTTGASIGQGLVWKGSAWGISTGVITVPTNWDLPAGAIAQTLSRSQAQANNALITSQQLYLTLIWLPTATITSITFVSGSTAATLPLNQWFGLFDASRNLLKLTVDDTTTAWGATTAKTLALSSTYAAAAGLYYVGVMVNASVAPSLVVGGTGTNSAAVGIAPIAHGNSSTGLTTPASCPNPAGAITAASPGPYAYVS